VACCKCETSKNAPGAENPQLSEMVCDITLKGALIRGLVLPAGRGKGWDFGAAASWLLEIEVEEDVNEET
jgi:hypothetical protein